MALGAATATGAVTCTWQLDSHKCGGAPSIYGCTTLFTSKSIILQVRITRDLPTEISANMTDNIAPFLGQDDFNPRGWISFVSAYEAYKARGGRQPVGTLISSSVLDFIMEIENCTAAELQLADRVVKAINQIFAPRSKEEARARLSAVRMKTPISVANYASFCFEWAVGPDATSG